MFEDNLLIASDNVLIKKAVKNWIFSLQAHIIKNPLAILFLEGEVNSFEQLNFILNSQLKYFLIFTTDGNINLISSIKTQKKIMLESLGLPLSCIVEKITAFIMISHNAKGKLHFPSREKKLLTIAERQVLTLYIRGVSVANIAKRLNKNKKTVYTQKNNCMKKLGFCKTIDLIKKADLIMMIQQEGLL